MSKASKTTNKKSMKNITCMNRSKSKKRTTTTTTTTIIIITSLEGSKFLTSVAVALPTQSVVDYSAAEAVVDYSEVEAQASEETKATVEDKDTNSSSSPNTMVAISNLAPEDTINNNKNLAEVEA